MHYLKTLWSRMLSPRKRGVRVQKKHDFPPKQCVLGQSGTAFLTGNWKDMMHRYKALDQRNELDPAIMAGSMAGSTTQQRGGNQETCWGPTGTTSAAIIRCC